MTIRYRVPETHHTVTQRGDAEHHGSVHHPELTEFAGMVTREHDDGSADLIIFPPHRNPVHVDKVPEGEGHGTFTRETAAPAAAHAPRRGGERA